MTTREKLGLLQSFVGHTLRNADGLRYPYNLDKIKKMVKEVIKEYDKENSNASTL